MMINSIYDDGYFSNMAAVDIAIESTNPTVIDALAHLLVLVKIAEPEMVNNRIEDLRRMHRQNFMSVIDPNEAHQIVDDVLEHRDYHAIAALENLIDVGRDAQKSY